jgi:uncharacterized protein YqjF (DUF2071 family)
VYFFSLDCASPLAVFGARTLFHLPYFPARMARITDGAVTHYKSRRQFSATAADYESEYGPTAAPASEVFGADPLSRFLTERYCLFTPGFGRMLIGHIHHVPWPLQPAEAEIRLNLIPHAHGISLPDTPPILHFSRHLQVLLWGLRTDGPGDSSYC